MAKPRIELPADLATEFGVPEGASIEDLTALEQQARLDAEKLLASDDTATAGERVAKANWLLGAIKKINDRQAEIATSNEQQAAMLNEARSKLKPTDPAADGVDPAAVDPANAVAQVVNDVGASPAATDDDPDKEPGVKQSGDAGDPSANVPQEPVLVASSRQVSIRRSAISDAKAGGSRQQVPVTVTKSREAFLTASSEVPGYAPGDRLDWAALGVASSTRFDQLPEREGGGRVQLPFARVNIPSDPGLVASSRVGKDQWNLDDAIEWAISGDRLERETGERSLTAAGWCAPSETLYDLLDVSTADGMLNIPGITVSRGGVRYSLGPDFATVYNAGQYFTQTEAQNISGTHKPVVNIPCPGFTDHRMVVDGMYLTGDILSAKGYPEAYADFNRKALTGWAHYVNKQTIAEIVTLTGAATDLTQAVSNPLYYETLSASTEILGAVELAITDMRYKNRLSNTAALDVVLPLWIKGAVRSDLGKRQGVDLLSVTDAQIAAWFALRGAQVQFVLDWQDAFSGVAAGFGAATAITSWPQSVEFLIYPQGGYVRALSDVIELNAVYDSTLLTTNQYVFLFMEQARLTLKRTFDTRRYKVPVNVSGTTGAAKDYTALQPTV